jgi:hypothetical protein
MGLSCPLVIAPSLAIASEYAIKSMAASGLSYNLSVRMKRVVLTASTTLPLLMRLT